VTSSVPFRARGVLPLPAVVSHPGTLLAVAGLHVYLAAGHLVKLAGGEVNWENTWKGFGALGGAYVFIALASRTEQARQMVPEKSISSGGAADTQGSR